MQLLTTKNFQLATYSAGDPQSLRLALVLPGRLDTKDYAHLRSHVDFLAQKGYFALSFDPPGSWESPGGLSLYTTPNYLKAIDELIEHMGDKPTVLMGHSRGGTMAMLAGIHNPHVTHFIAVMSHFGPSYPKPEKARGTIYITHRDLPPGIKPTEDKKRFDLPMSYFDDPTEYTGMEHCSKPKLFFYGSHDTTVPPDQVITTFEKAAEPKILKELPCAHRYRHDPKLIALVNDTVAEFLCV